MRHSSERGIAMITTLLVMMLISAVLVGFTAVVMSDQRYRFIDKDRGQAFYAASGAVEKLTADLGNQFFATVAPTAAQITALTVTPPTISGISYSGAAAPSPLPSSPLADATATGCGPSPKQVKRVGTNGYTIMYCTDASGNPVTTGTATVCCGAYAGLTALKTPYQIDVTAKTTTGGEVHLIRSMEAVAIPVFQFGMFSDVDLSFFAGPDFNFGGRVHTNGNLFLAQGGGATLTLTDKVTAVKEVIRQRLQNGASIDTSPTHDGTVSMAKAAGSYRALARTEGSVTDGVGSSLNDPKWQTISLSTYNSFIRNGRTGAKPLNLPLLTVGGTNPDLIRRPPAGENTANPVLFNERMFSKASLRILLSDTAADITGLPTVTSTAPVLLDGDWATTPPNNGTAYGPINSSHPPIARSLGSVSVLTTAKTNAGDTTITAVPPAWFRKPQITARNPAGTSFVGPFTCDTWNHTSWTSCHHTATLTSGWTLYVSSGSPSYTAVAGNMPGNPVPLGILNTTVSTGTSKVLQLQGTYSTWQFAANTFWLNDTGSGGTGSSTVVTCTGATATTFIGCTGVPATKTGATITSGYLTPQNTGTIGGYLKAERQDATGAWTDVTMEILNYGIGGQDLDGLCGDPTPNAILRIQRLRDNGSAPSCPNAGSINSYEYWPNSLFDPREALQRDNDPGNKLVILGGVMYYISIDAANLAKWFKGAAPYAAGTGANSITDNGGFTVYFSDRRNNRNAANTETGQYGFEDFVNPSISTGAPNNVLDAGEDVDGSGTLDTYGQFPSYNGIASSVVTGSTSPLDANARPTSSLTAGAAVVNRSVLFRHALKLINGSALGAVITGLTVVSENPVYVQGNWNASGAFNDPHAATSVLADAVTLLSGNWNDGNSFASPYDPGGRVRTQSWYRLAIVSGKGMPFQQPSGTATDFGTDGGAHNFLRLLEDGSAAVNYRGSIATFFYNREAVGTYKCCNTVYQAPSSRNFAFDIDFLSPALLPPNTPVFRDLNAIGFSQELRPNK